MFIYVLTLMVSIVTHVFGGHMKDEILSKWFDGYNKRDWAALESLYSDDALIHAKCGDMRGGVSVVNLCKNWLLALPDTQISPLRIDVEGDVIVAHWKATGTFKEPIMNISPSGKKVSFHGITHFRSRDGRVVEHWSTIDYRPLRAHEKDSQPNHTVMVILQAKKGKEDELKQRLLHVAKLSRQEGACIQYHVFQDPEDLTKFSLFEQWKSKELHALQFEKPYILEFGSMAEELLAGPYHGFFGKKLL